MKEIINSVLLMVKKYNNTSLYISTISVVGNLLQLYMVSGLAQVYIEGSFAVREDNAYAATGM